MAKPSAGTSAEARRRAAAAAALLIALVVASGASAAGIRWQTERARGSAGSLAGISCPTATSCTAVGVRYATPRTEALAESWNGETWKLDRVAQPAGTTSATLLSVSCASPGMCVAVGYTGEEPPTHSRPFAEVLHGTRWKTVAVPSQPGSSGGELEAVSCEAAGSCAAVGSYTTASGGGALVAAFAGSSWRLEHAAKLAGVASLDAVSCLPQTVPALCTAVGSTDVSGRSTPLAEHLNGSSWTAVHLPAVPPTENASLTAVSCPQPTSCVAVGTSHAGAGTEPISAVENLLHWTSPSPPGRAEGASLLGVSCGLTIDSCQAVGSSGTAALATLAESWNGRAWSIERSANPSPLSLLDAVSCVTTSGTLAACAAGGSYQPDPNIASRPFAERG